MDPDPGGPKTSGSGAAILIGAVSFSHERVWTLVSYSSGFFTPSYLILDSLYQIESIQYRIRSDRHHFSGSVSASRSDRDPFNHMCSLLFKENFNIHSVQKIENYGTFDAEEKDIPISCMCEIESRVRISHQNVICRIRISINTMPIHNKEFIPPRLLFTLKKNGLHVVTIHNDTLSIEFFPMVLLFFFYYCTPLRRENLMYNNLGKSVLNLGFLVPQFSYCTFWLKCSVIPNLQMQIF
jgi:hypothetical protein